MNILGYNLLPKPLARNVTVSPTPRALGLFLLTKSLFLRRAAAYLHSPLVVLAGQSCANRQQTPPPFFVYGLGGKAAAQTSRRGGMGEFWRGRRSLAEAFPAKEGRGVQPLFPPSALPHASSRRPGVNKKSIPNVYANMPLF